MTSGNPWNLHLNPIFLNSESGILNFMTLYFICAYPMSNKMNSVHNNMTYFLPFHIITRISFQYISSPIFFATFSKFLIPNSRQIFKASWAAKLGLDSFAELSSAESRWLDQKQNHKCSENSRYDLLQILHWNHLWNCHQQNYADSRNTRR